MTQRPGLSAARTSYLQAPLSSSPGRHTGRGVLGRADIALGFARKAIAILQSIETGPASTGDQVRRHVNPRFAEVVSLNTPGLRNGGAGGDPGLRAVELDNGFPARFDYGLERTADMAPDLVPDDAILRAALRAG
jgi:hypothetical protein